MQEEILMDRSWSGPFQRRLVEHFSWFETEYGYTLAGSCFFPFKAISKSNEMLTGVHGKKILSSKYRAFEANVALLAKVSFGMLMAKEGHILIQPYFKTKTHIDTSNTSKSIFDALKKGHVLFDDKLFGATALNPVYCKQDAFGILLWKKDA